jgi:hypothetical protein
MMPMGARERYRETLTYRMRLIRKAWRRFIRAFVAQCKAEDAINKLYKKVEGGEL